MSQITPGYNFTTTEQVTASKLRQFVEGTVVQHLNWSEIDPTIPRFAVVNDTAFSLGPEGSVWWDGVDRCLMVQSNFGPVCLWADYKMETRRFACNPAGVGDYIKPFVCVAIDTSGSPSSISELGFELKAGTGPLSMSSRVLGSLQTETATTLTFSRIVMQGVTKAYFSSWEKPGEPGRYVGAGDAAGEWTQEGNTSVDKICGVTLGPSATEASGVSNIGWIFIFPNTWRD